MIVAKHHAPGRCVTASAKLSATRRPRSRMPGSAVWTSACPNSNAIACRPASLSARMATCSPLGNGEAAWRLETEELLRQPITTPALRYQYLRCGTSMRHVRAARI